MKKWKTFTYEIESKKKACMATLKLRKVYFKSKDRKQFLSDERGNL